LSDQHSMTPKPIHSYGKIHACCLGMGWVH